MRQTHLPVPQITIVKSQNRGDIIKRVFKPDVRLLAKASLLKNDQTLVLVSDVAVFRPPWASLIRTLTTSEKHMSYNTVHFGWTRTIEAC